jgi:hypothetical protein
LVAGGRVLAHGSPAALKSRLGAPLRLECTLEPDVPSPRLPEGVVAAGLAGRRLLAHVQSAGVGAAVAWARKAQEGGVVAEFALMPASLEDVYASWVSTEGAA